MDAIRTVIAAAKMRIAVPGCQHESRAIARRSAFVLALVAAAKGKSESAVAKVPSVMNEFRLTKPAT
jgi:hypothetical protein